MEKIIDASPEWLRPLILTSYYTGLRMGELLGLKWEWVDLKEGVIYLPWTKTLKDQTGKGQKVVMQTELIALFKKLPKKHDLIFCQIGGEPFKHWHVYQPFKKVLAARKIDPKEIFLEGTEAHNRIPDAQEGSARPGHQRPAETLQYQDHG